MNAAEENCAWVRQRVAERGWTDEIEALAEARLRSVVRARLSAWWTMRVLIPIGALFLALQAIKEMRGET